MVDARPRGPISAVAVPVTLVLTFVLAIRPAVDNDLWWHLRIGQWMVDHHRLLGADPFSHTAGSAARVPYDWLAQLAIFGTWRVGGFPAISVAVALLAVLGIALIATACPGRAVVRAGVLLLAGAASSVFWSARPQMATFVGCAAVVAALAAARRGHDRLWWLVPGFVLWSNLHLGWFYGLALLWGTSIGWSIDRRSGRDRMSPDPVSSALVRKLVGVSAACSVAVLVHPAGIKLFGLVVTQASVGSGFIQEDAPPGLRYGAAIFFYLLIALTAVALVRDRRRVTVTELGLLTASALGGCLVARLIPMFATVAAPVLCRHLDAVLPSRPLRATPDAADAASDRRFRRLALAGVVVAALGVSWVRSAPPAFDGALTAEEPVAAVQWLQAHHPPGRLWNTFDWGGYLIWALPAYPVSIDGRADLHADRLADHRANLEGRDWQQTFDHEGVNIALVPTAGPLASAISRSPAWHLAYRDPQAAIFTRR